MLAGRGGKGKKKFKKEVQADDLGICGAGGTVVETHRG